MLQRIQSIYLIIAALLCVAFLFIPSLESGSIVAKNLLPLLILTVISAVISVADIFLWRNRPLQMNVGKLNLLLILGIMGYAVYAELSDGDFEPYFGAIIPLVFFIFNAMAIRAINKDEKLVKSMDRLR